MPDQLYNMVFEKLYALNDSKGNESDDKRHKSKINGFYAKNNS